MKYFCGKFLNTLKFARPDRPVFKNGAPERAEAAEPERRGPQASREAKIVYEENWKALKFNLEKAKKDSDPKVREVAEKYEHEMGLAMDPSTIRALRSLDKKTLDENLSKVRDVLSKFGRAVSVAKGWAKPAPEEQKEEEGAPAKARELGEKTTSYHRRHAEVMQFLAGVIDGTAIADLEMTEQEREKMKAQAKEAFTELKLLPADIGYLKKDAAEELAKKYLLEIETIMSKYFGGGEEPKQTPRQPEAPKPEAPKKHEPVLREVAGEFGKKRDKALNDIRELVLGLHAQGFEDTHPAITVARDAIVKISKLKITDKKGGDVVSNQEGLQTALRELRDDLEKCNWKEQDEAIQKKLASVYEDFLRRFKMKSGQQERTEVAEMARRRDAVGYAIGRSMDKIYGRYQYLGAGGKMKNLPGNNMPAEPGGLIYDINQELGKMSTDMSAEKPDTEWKIERDGITVLVTLKKFNEKNKPSYSIQLMDYEQGIEDKFPAIAAYIDRHKAEEKLAANQK